MKKELADMTHEEFERYLKKNHITGWAAINLSHKRRNQQVAKTRAMVEETVERFAGRCSHCGHETESLRAGETACKWGGCNGTVFATRRAT